MSGCSFLPKNKKIRFTAIPDSEHLRLSKTVFIILIIISCYLVVSAYHAMGYKDGVYVCRHMARDIEDALEKTGIDVQVVSGKNVNGKTSHMWVKIYGLDVDSVTLLPMSFLINKKYINIKVYDDYKLWAKDRYSNAEYQDLLLEGEL